MTVIFSGQRWRRPGLVQIRKGKSAPAKRTYTPHLGNKKAKKFIRWSTIFQSRRPEINFTTCACRIVLERQSRQWTQLLPINYSIIFSSFVDTVLHHFSPKRFSPWPRVFASDSCRLLYLKQKHMKDKQSRTCLRCLA